MRTRKALFIFCWISSTFCLAGGYALLNQWLGMGLVVLIGLGWLVGWKYRAGYLANFCMISAVCLACAGLLWGAAYGLMIAGASFALAVWDVLLLMISIWSLPANPGLGAYEKKHLQSLGLAIGIGLAASLSLHWVNFRLPFIVMLLLVVLAGYGIERILAALRNLPK